MPRYCVLGGTGFLGRRVVIALARRGHEVLVPTRSPAPPVEIRTLPLVRPVHTDVNRPGSLPPLLAGCAGVVNLIGILNERGRDGREFRRVHVGLVQALVAACEAAGVRRLVHVSALNAGHPEARSHYLRTKGEAETILRGSPLAWTILRPSVIYGPGDGFVNRFAGLLRLSPGIMLLPMPEARFAPVHVDDVAAAIVRSLTDPTTINGTYELCGREVLTLREVVARIAEVAGLRRLVVGLPRPAAALLARVMDHVPGKPFSTDNFRSLQLDSVCTENGCAQLGITPRSLTYFLPQALSAVARPGPLDRIRRQAGR